MKPVEYGRAFRFGNAWPVVGHREPDGPVRDTRPNLDSPIHRGVGDRIPHEVPQRLGQAVGVGDHRDRWRLAEAEVTGRGVGLAAYQIIEEARQVDLSGPQEAL